MSIRFSPLELSHLLELPRKLSLSPYVWRLVRKLRAGLQVSFPNTSQRVPSRGDVSEVSWRCRRVSKNTSPLRRSLEGAETRGLGRFPRPLQTSKLCWKERRTPMLCWLIVFGALIENIRKRIIRVLESRRDYILSGVDIQKIRVPHNRMSSITSQKLWSDVHTHTPRNIKTHAYQSFFSFFLFLACVSICAV